MLTVMVDFNARRGNEVRGLSEEVIGDDEPQVGENVLLDDGEGNTAWGRISRVERNLIFATVQWNTWGGPRRIVQGDSWVELPGALSPDPARQPADPYSTADVPENEAGRVPALPC